ncbi:MAG: YceI family protein [Rhizomicrobium sp.]
MRRLAVLGAVFALHTVVAQAAGVSTDTKQAPAGAYQIEPRHTVVLFAIPHLGITDYYGRFEKTSGTLNFTPGAPEKSSVSITIDMPSLNVPNSELLEELVAGDAFDTAKFPQATFTSTSLERTGPTSGRMTGDLTIHGVTRPVTFDVTFNGGAPSPMGPGYYLGFHAATSIKRSDFGLDKMGWTGFVGDDVKLTVEALFQKQKG